jgi:hypothetical protein
MVGRGADILKKDFDRSAATRRSDPNSNSNSGQPSSPTLHGASLWRGTEGTLSEVGIVVSGFQS